MPYIANKRNVAQLTNIHYWDSAGNAWSGNLIGVALPFALLPNPVLAPDLVIFGIDTSVVDSGPFCSLAFDIGVTVTGVTVAQWTYSDAGGADPNTWQGFIALPGPIQDNTDQGGLMTGVAFDTSGVVSIHWEQPALWIVQNPTIGGVALGVTGYWVCWDPTTVPGAATPPTQNNRDVYSILWPAVEVAAADVGGDIPALMRVPLRCESSAPAVALTEANRIIVGARSTYRGEDFVSHINFSPDQNPALMDLGSSGVFLADVQSPCASKASVIPGAAWGEDGTIRIHTGLAEQYRGLFHVFLRIDATTLNLEVRIDAALFTAAPGVHENLVFSSKVATPRSLNPWEVLDFGRVQLIPDDVSDDDLVNVEIRVMMQDDGIAPCYFYDLILIPIDEWAGEFDMAQTGSTPWGERSTLDILGTIVDIDSVTMPRRAMNSVLRNWSTGEFIYRPRFIGRAPAVLQANETQRIYFLIIDDQPTYVTSHFELAGSTAMEIVQRYLSMRGPR